MILTAELIHQALAEAGEYKCWSQSTIYNANKIATYNILSAFEHRDLSTLTAADIENWLYTMPVRNKTKLNRLAALKHIFQYCWRKKWLRYNPCADVVLVNDTRAGLADPWSIEEEMQIMNVALPFVSQSSSNPYPSLYFEKLAFQFCISMGLRKGEICALAWEDIDMEALEIEVNRNHDSRHYCDLKNASTRSSQSFSRRLAVLDKPFSAASILRELENITTQMPPITIKRWYKDSQSWQDEAVHLVFHNTTTLGPLHPKTLEKQMKKLCDAAQVRYRPFKQCRHTFCSRSLTAGNDAIDIMLRVIRHLPSKRAVIIQRFRRQMSDQPQCTKPRDIKKTNLPE